MRINTTHLASSSLLQQQRSTTPSGKLHRSGNALTGYDQFEPSIETNPYHNYQDIFSSRRQDVAPTIDTLVQTIKKDEHYMDFHEKGLFIGQETLEEKHPEVLELQKQLILNADAETQDMLKKLIHSQIKNAYFGGGSQDDQSDAERYAQAGIKLKSNYQDYNLEAMLNSDSALERQLIEFTHFNFLVMKAQTTGLSEPERISNIHAARVERWRGPEATLENKLGDLAAQIDEVLQNAAQPPSSKDAFTIKFNNDFSFSVSGGAADQSRLFENFLNEGGENTLRKVVYSLLFHRREGGAFNPWGEDYYSAELHEAFGIGDADEELQKGMAGLHRAHQHHEFNELLKEIYGAEISDFELQDGVLSGKTDAARAAIQNPALRNSHHDDALLDYLKNPLQEYDLSFLNLMYQDGKFHLEYE